tara:strand:- start:249 stop:878 length:630 start_codon:yes stop_codon:yes gene_type:complete
MDIDFRVLKPLGPSIVKVKIPEKILNNLNNYIDEVIKNEIKSNELDHGSKLFGDVTQEFKLENEFSKKIGWIDFLAMCTSKWIQTVANKKISKFTLINSWVVRQFENEYNPAHYHSGHISGAGFLKLPKSFGNFVQKKDKAYLGGTLNLIHGSRQFLSNPVYTIKPEVGDFYFFPHYLMHAVYPFKGTSEERRSISFNALIDDEIYNQV